MPKCLFNIRNCLSSLPATEKNTISLNWWCSPLKMTHIFIVKIVMSALQPVRESFIDFILVSSCFVSPGLFSQSSLHHSVNTSLSAQNSLKPLSLHHVHCSLFHISLSLSPGGHSRCSIRRQQAGSYHQSEETDPRWGSAPFLHQPDNAGATSGL